MAAPYCYRCPWGSRPTAATPSAPEQSGRFSRRGGKPCRGDRGSGHGRRRRAGTAESVLPDPSRHLRSIRGAPHLRRGAHGYGCLGHLFAADYYEVVPDLICLGKGSAPATPPGRRGGAGPCRRRVPRRSGEDLSPRTHVRRPPAGLRHRARGNDEIVGRDLVRQAGDNGAYLGERLSSLAEKHPEIGDVRGLGMLWCLEFVADRLTKTPFLPQVVCHRGPAAGEGGRPANPRIAPHADPGAAAHREPQRHRRDRRDGRSRDRPRPRGDAGVTANQPAAGIALFGLPASASRRS